MAEALGEALPAADRNGGRDHSAVDDEGRLRADTYAIPASLLNAPPTQDLLDCLKHIEPAPDDDGRGDLGQAWRKIRCAPAQADLQSLDDEYHDLFIGLGRGEVVPYGSWHFTGFLMEQP